jgi:hypothetical protein
MWESGQWLRIAEARGMVCTQSPTALRRMIKTRGFPGIRPEIFTVFTAVGDGVMGWTFAA